MVGAGEANGNAYNSSSDREMANMEIRYNFVFQSFLKEINLHYLILDRIRDLESKLSEKEMLIHLLQRASMDRELAFSTTRLPESVSLLNRHLPNVTSHEHQSQHPVAASTTSMRPPGPGPCCPSPLTCHFFVLFFVFTFTE